MVSCCSSWLYFDEMREYSRRWLNKKGFLVYCENTQAIYEQEHRIMSVRMSVVLPDELVHTVKILSHQYKSQSVFVETALRRFIRQIRREEQHQQDLEMINRHADRLNAETSDALDYQIPL